MRRLRLMLLVALACLICPFSLMAQTNETETITDNATPEAGKRKNNTNNIVLMTTGIMIFGGCCYYMLNKQKQLTLEVANTHLNEDGSLTVKLAYNNPRNEKVVVDQNEISVNAGLAIILEKDDICALEPRKQKDVMTIVINENTNLTWNINNESISISGKDLLGKEIG